MVAKKMGLLIGPIVMMVAILFGMSGIETWLAGFGKTPDAYQTLGRIGLALPYVVAAAIGVIFLLTTRGSLSIQSAGQGVLLGGLAVAMIGVLRETTRIMSFADQIPDGQIGQYLDLYSLGGSAIALGSALFGLKVAMRGNMAFGSTGPKRLRGTRAVHGANDWMTDAQAAKLFPATGGIVVGENYRPDNDVVGEVGFDARKKETWGKGGKAPLLCFDAGFGSTHGLVFAASGGFKTTSVVIPTALKFKGTLIVLDPSTEIAPMVSHHRRENHQRVFTLDPHRPEIGFNVLDWIGKHGNSAEEDIASVAAWLMSEKPRVSSGSDDFFRTTAEQLITAIIADVI